MAGLIGGEEVEISEQYDWNIIAKQLVNTYGG